MRLWDRRPGLQARFWHQIVDWPEPFAYNHDRRDASASVQTLRTRTGRIIKEYGYEAIAGLHPSSGGIDGNIRTPQIEQGQRIHVPDVTDDVRKLYTANAFMIIPALRGNGIGKLFSTHPAVEDEVARLRAMEREMMAAQR